MCHAGTLLPIDDHAVLCAWFGGSYEGEADTAIYLSTVRDGRPGEARRLACADEPHWNPVLFRLRDGRAALIFKRGAVIAAWRSYVMYSADDGATWSAPQELVPGDRGGRGPVRNKPLVLPGGRMLFPGSREDGEWRAFVDYTDDDLKTLHQSAPIRAAPPAATAAGAGGRSDIAVSAQSFRGAGVIQPTLFRDAGGVHMLLRSTYGCVMRSDSRDDGLTWTPAYPLSLPNNNSGIDLDQYEGTLYLACNPVRGNWAVRSPLVLMSSHDGLDFSPVEELEREPGAEFSYPCVRVSGTDLYISYTYKRQNIRLVKYDLSA